MCSRATQRLGAIALGAFLAQACVTAGGGPKPRVIDNHGFEDHAACMEAGFETGTKSYDACRRNRVAARKSAVTGMGVGFLAGF